MKQRTKFFKHLSKRFFVLGVVSSLGISRSIGVFSDFRGLISLHILQYNELTSFCTLVLIKVSTNALNKQIAHSVARNISEFPAELSNKYDKDCLFCTQANPDGVVLERRS